MEKYFLILIPENILIQLCWYFGWKLNFPSSTVSNVNKAFDHKYNKFKMVSSQWLQKGINIPKMQSSVSKTRGSDQDSPCNIINIFVKVIQIFYTREVFCL